jgi:hypothetical protein
VETPWRAKTLTFCYLLPIAIISSNIKEGKAVKLDFTSTCE